jgi:hypothetical protein
MTSDFNMCLRTNNGKKSPMPWLHYTISFVCRLFENSTSNSPSMSNTSNALPTSPTAPEHVWYYDADDDDVPMGQPGSSKPTSLTTDNGI